MCLRVCCRFGSVFVHVLNIAIVPLLFFPNVSRMSMQNLVVWFNTLLNVLLVMENRYQQVVRIGGAVVNTMTALNISKNGFGKELVTFVRYMCV